MVRFNDIIVSDPEILGGERVFAGTRVPVRALIDYFVGGDTLESFLEDFPSVTRDQALGSLEIARAALTTNASPS